MSWLKVKQAALYAGVSVRTFENWLGRGLKCAHLPTGLRLIKTEWIDEYLEQFGNPQNKVDQIVNEVMAKA